MRTVCTANMYKYYIKMMLIGNIHLKDNYIFVLLGVLFKGTGIQDYNGLKVVWLDRPEFVLLSNICLHFLLTVPLILYSSLKFLSRILV